MRAKKTCQLLVGAAMAASAVYAAPMSAAASGVTYEVTSDDDGWPFTVKYTKGAPWPGFQPTPENLDKISGTDEHATGTWTKTVPLGSADNAVLMGFHENDGPHPWGNGHMTCKITFNGKVIDEEDGVLAQCMGPAARAHMPAGS